MKKNPNRNARATGSHAEALLLAQLVEQGYEARRTHLSAFPDIIAWNYDEFLLIEVKARTTKAGATKSLSLFRSSVRNMTCVHKSATVLCYVRLNGHWNAYMWCNNNTKQVAPVVAQET